MDKLIAARAALLRLANAADAYAADQSYSNDKRLGMVQPITVAEGEELNQALKRAWEVLGEDIDTTEQKEERDALVREQLNRLLSLRLREEGNEDTEEG